MRGSAIRGIREVRLSSQLFALRGRAILVPRCLSGLLARRGPSCIRPTPRLPGSTRSRDQCQESSSASMPRPASGTLAFRSTGTRRCCSCRQMAQDPTSTRPDCSRWPFAACGSRQEYDGMIERGFPATGRPMPKVTMTPLRQRQGGCRRSVRRDTEGHQASTAATRSTARAGTTASKNADARWPSTGARRPGRAIQAGTS